MEEQVSILEQSQEQSVVDAENVVPPSANEKPVISDENSLDQKEENSNPEENGQHEKKEKIRRVRKQIKREKRDFSDGGLVRAYMNFIKRQVELSKPRPPKVEQFGQPPPSLSELQPIGNFQ